MTVSVRYIVTDVEAAIAFYTGMLGFTLDMRPAPPFAIVSRDDLRLLLSQPGAGGGGQALDGQSPAPGGWNRFQLEVDDLPTTIEALKAKGCKFRSEMIIGNGGNQILLEDPSGNPVELFQSTRRAG
jgi:catechol 2,3-dioxygenase-like lactoylglutathione lyase family enzyme